METKKLIGGLLAGAAIGIAIGMLLAPRSGAETQKKILGGSKRLADDLKNAVSSSFDSVKNRYNGAVDDTARRGKEVISQASERVKV
jgi:gas vesicle protein